MENERPLADVKVLDFMWAMAGPGSTRILADYGATIVRVESTTRFDAVRMVGPFHDGQPGPESSGLFYNMNTGKLPMTLNMSKAPAKEVIVDLVRWADVVTESFSPRAMKAWGLDYEALRKLKPDIIMLSTCLMGQTGPLSKFAGFGNLAAAISGFFDPTGWPDRPPAGPFGAYTDYIAPWYNAAAILTALEYKRRTGQGQHIDLSQAEAALHFMAPALLDYTANGNVQTRTGNQDRNYAPHGVYPAAGNDAWIAIATQTEEQWQALCQVIERPEWAGDERFATAKGRRAHQDEIDAAISAWTSRQDVFGAEARLQQDRVPASAVRTMHQLYQDPQLLHREHFVDLEHPQHGTTTVEGSRFKLSRTPAQVGGSAATLGRENQYVLEKILGYSEEKITQLVSAEVLE
jgi:crotonobetainyl-CoA:carnitine CoA-transferase CaiB-like acyl-CoA transferase